MNRNDKDYLVQKIRADYTEREHTELDSLKELDRKVKLPANVFAYVFGSIAAIIMGCGMSLVMTDIGTTLSIPHYNVVGIAVGCVGLILALVNYTIFKGILNSRKKKYAYKIFELSESIMRS